MPIKPLPSKPNLDHLKHQARDLRLAHHAADPAALQRLREFHPRFQGQDDATIAAAPLSLADAQLAIARERSFPSWARLKAYVEGGDFADQEKPYQERIEDPNFRAALAAIDAGDVASIRRLVGEHPALLRQRVYFDRSYFGQPYLLEFVAENPIRHRSMPENVLEVARTLLELGATGASETLGLVTSGCVAREYGFQISLIDLLCDHGADPTGALPGALVHSEFASVEALLRRGAVLDLPTAAGLGRTEETRRLLPSASAEARHLALAFAAQHGRNEALALLLDAGEDPNRFNPMGAHSHSTPLHQAAVHGHLNTVRLLVERGARLDIADILWNGTPLGWARHEDQTEIAEYLEEAARKGVEYS